MIISLKFNNRIILQLAVELRVHGMVVWLIEAVRQ